jgi:hypothetical protein
MFDMRAYVKDKIEKHEPKLHLYGAPPYDLQGEADSIVFVVSRDINREWAVAVSISGLETLQNSTEEAIKDLIDARFNNAMKTLDNGLKELGARNV